MDKKITANEMTAFLNEAQGLAINMEDVENWFLRAENPIVSLGDKLLKEYHFCTGTKICYE